MTNFEIRKAAAELRALLDAVEQETMSGGTPPNVRARLYKLSQALSDFEARLANPGAPVYVVRVVNPYVCVHEVASELPPEVSHRGELIFHRHAYAPGAWASFGPKP